MAADPIYRDTGDTAPAITAQLLVNGSPMTLSGASIIGRVGGTVGSGALATYQRWDLAATWNSASIGDASVTIPLNPSALAPSNFPCASPANLRFEIRAVTSGGDTIQWPPLKPIPFIVRIRT